MIGGNCRNSPAAIDNVKEYTSTVKQITLEVPKEILYNSVTWIEGMRYYLIQTNPTAKKSFQRR